MKTLFIFDGTTPDFLLAMSAVRSYVREVPGASAAVCTTSPEQAELLNGAWFLKTSFSIENPDDFDTAGYDCVADLVCDRAECLSAELIAKRAQREQIDQLMLDFAVANKTPVEKLPKPSGYEKLADETPTWHKLHGYCHEIGKVTTSPYNIKEATPFLPQVPKLRDIANRYIQRSEELRPGAPFVIVDGLDHFTKRDSEIIYPEWWGIAYADEVDTITLAGLLSHKLCNAVIGPIGTATYLGWAAGVPLVVESVEDPADVNWLASRNEAAVPVDITTNAGGPKFREVLRGLYSEKCGVEIE